jgi:ligand-binding SRPBCC domain-containing protein
MEHTLHHELKLPAPVEAVFAFFAEAANLERITPPELTFKIITPLPMEIKEGALIDYKLGLFGMSFNWTTLISEWDPPRRFVDKQLKGPYALWEHTHTFESLPDGGTLIVDNVIYKLPWTPLGDAAFPLVKKQLTRIFEYRQEKMVEEFGQWEA